MGLRHLMERKLEYLFVWARRKVQRWGLLFSEAIVNSSGFMSNIRVSCRM